MQIQHDDMDAAIKAGLISSEQAKKLWTFWQAKQSQVPTFQFSHVLYYLGGMIAISAVTLFVTSAWDVMRGFPLLILSLMLAIFGIGLIHYFLNKQLRIPAGIMATFSLALVPLAVYNMQIILGFNPDFPSHYSDFHYIINWNWVVMELVTLLVGAFMLYYYRFPFLLFPISVVLWYMSMDLWPLLFHMHDYTWEDRATFSMLFGLIILAAAIYMDFKYDVDELDYAFWLYIFGVMTFWGGLSSHESTSEISKFIYCMINLGMILIGAFLNRRVFAVFGALGILGYIGHLAFDVFADSLGFPVALVFLGVAIILMAAAFTRIERKLLEIMRPYTPKKILRKM